MGLHGRRQQDDRRRAVPGGWIDRLFVSDPLRWDGGWVLQWPFAIGAEDVESAHQTVEMHALALYYHATA